MRDVLIISRDWQSRALLRAQLIEEGCNVRAFRSARDAAAALGRGVFHPRLAIADLSAGTDPAEVEQVAGLARRLPVWVIASRSAPGDWLQSLQGRDFEVVLFRPVDLGELVKCIKERVNR